MFITSAIILWRDYHVEVCPTLHDHNVVEDFLAKKGAISYISLVFLPFLRVFFYSYTIFKFKLQVTIAYTHSDVIQCIPNI